MGHVYGLDVDGADGTLYAAARNGVFRISPQGKATRIANRDQDTTGDFLAIGHPEPAGRAARRSRSDREHRQRPDLDPAVARR